MLRALLAATLELVAEMVSCHFVVHAAELPPEVTGDTPAPEKPTAYYWHAWTDENGVSRQTRCELRAFEKQSMGGAAPQWNNRLSASRAIVITAVQPIGWVGEWHENPMPQWIVPLSGRWFVETMDGTRIEMGPGEASFGNDQNSRADAQGRKGHRSGTVGSKPAVLMIIQLEQGAATGQPCPFK